MYYDQPQERGDRFARRIVYDANREIAQFVSQYQEAKKRNDQGLYLEANVQRTAVQSEIERIKIEIPELPEECQAVVEEAKARAIAYASLLLLTIWQFSDK